MRRITLRISTSSWIWPGSPFILACLPFLVYRAWVLSVSVHPEAGPASIAQARCVRVNSAIEQITRAICIESSTASLRQVR